MLLLLLKIIIRKKCSIMRLLSASAIGGATAAVINLLPWINSSLDGTAVTVLLRVLGFLIKPASLVWMVRAAIGKMNWKELIRYSISFFLITCFAGGFLNSVYYHTELRLILIQLDYSVVFSNLPMWTVIVAILCIVPVAYLLVWLRKRYLGNKKEIFEIEMICGEQSTKAKGLFDTGNCLYDPISHSPVIIVENRVMERIIPSECRSILSITEYQNLQSEAAASSELLDHFLLRFHLIPYRSIGKEQGIMPGIVLDSIRIKMGEEICCQERVTAAICNHTLSSGGEYQVILHKELLEGK